jgi:ATP-dependent exoDNAse (exonuclease V) beta subunit
MSQHIRFISAGAGSGKTYRITQDLQAMLAGDEVRPSGVIATTFTRLAATERYSNHLHAPSRDRT